MLDVLGGVIPAQGITIALLNRCMNKVGTKITSSLMSAATLLCADDFQKLHCAFNINPVPKSKLYGVYVTKQGEIAVECCDTQTLLRLAKALDIEIAIEQATLQQQLGDLFRSKTADEWVVILQQASVPAVVVIENLADLQNSAYLKSHLCSDSYTKVTSPWSFK